MALKLNEKAFAFAQQLIQHGRVDLNGGWSENEPTTKSENKYLSSHSFEEYGNWFLGVDPEASPDTKERYSFPYGNFQKLFRSGVVAAEQRAGQYKHKEIESAAKRLLKMIG